MKRLIHFALLKISVRFYGSNPTTSVKDWSTGKRRIAHRSSQQGTPAEGRLNHWHERTVTLPQGVETDKIAARCEHGVLEIRVPLPARLAGRKIPIQIDQKENKKLENKAA
jgi:Hsp20/alpha crystallin family